MRFYLLAFMRLLRSVSFPLMLAVTAAVIFAAPLIGREEALPPAALFDADQSPASAAVADLLAEDGFLRCPDEQSLRDGVRRGLYDCGLILPAGFGEALREGTLGESLVLVTSPVSLVPDLYRNQAAAAVFAVRAPYITADALSHTDITEAEVLAEYSRLAARGSLFTFSLTDGETAVLPADDRAVTYTVSAAAFLLFALLTGSFSAVLRDADALLPRTGAVPFLRSVLIPSAAVRTVSAAAVSALALLLSSAVSGDARMCGLILPVCAYALLLTAFAAVLCAILPDAGRIRTVSCFLLIASLVLCPVYLDVTLALPWLSYLRMLLPSFWMWAAAAHPVLALLIGTAAVPPALLLLYLRLHRRSVHRG